jgi:O-antigen/teichoic acid export membrane protein
MRLALPLRSRILRDAFPGAYYYASFAALPLLGLIQTRVLTALLSQSDYGAVQLATPIISWCIILGGLGTPQFLIRFYPRYGPGLFWEGLSTSLVATGLLATLLGILALTVDPGIPDVRPGPLLALLVVGMLFVGQLGALIKALLRVQERHLRYNAVVVLERLFILAGVALCVWLWRGKPLEAFLLGTILGTSGILFVVVAKRLGGVHRVINSPAPHRLREIVAFGAPIVAIMVLGEVHGTLSRYVIGLAGLGTEEVARYVIGYSVAMLGLQALYEPLVIYIQPRIFRAWERNGRAEAQRLLRRYVGLYAVVGAVTAVVFLAAEPWLIRLLAGSTYLLEPQVFAALLCASFAMGFYRFLATQYLLTKRTGELALSYLLAVLVNVIVAFGLVRQYGLLGVAMASLLSTGLLCFLLWWRGRTLVGRPSGAEVELALTGEPG